MNSLKSGALEGVNMNRQNASAMNGLLRTALVTIITVTLGMIGLAGSARAGQQVYSTVATGNWTAPSGAAAVTSVSVEVWGAGGGGGGDATNDNYGGCGGGGGAYSKGTATVTSGGSYPYQVGAGGAGNAGAAGSAGTASFFNNATTIMAPGGGGGGLSDGAGGGTRGAGGAAGSGFGTTKFTGGNGACANNDVAKTGGGSGGSAGTAANGNFTTTTQAGNAGAAAVTGGGPGVAGGAANSAGTTPASGPGGGGSGSGNRSSGGNKSGGAGFAGKVVINWNPNVTINQAGAQADPTNGATINFTVVFSESTTTFATGDVTITGTAGGTKTATVTGSGTTYNVAVTGMTTSGTVIAAIGAGVATDVFGNPNNASTSTDNTVTFTTLVNPTVTINQSTTAPVQADPTNGTITYKVVFSESVTGFVAGDITLAGTAPASVTSVTGSGTSYTVVVTATDSGTVIATIGAGVATGSTSGLPNVASTSTDNTVTFDNLPPSVAIEQAAAQADPTATSPITFTATFSENVTGFATTDVTLGGTATGMSVTSVTGGPTVYTVTVAVTGNGTVIASIPAGAATDAAGNTSSIASSVDNTVDFTGGGCTDATPSTLTIPAGQTVSGLIVNLAGLYTKTGNVANFTYQINAVDAETPWDSSNFGLTTPTVVSFKVTGTDPDCGGVVKTQTGNITVDNTAIDFMVHNSVTTGSTKWPIAQSGKTVNGWGITSAQYGKFECATCHVRSTTNVKRVKTTLTAPTDTFPIGAGAVQLLTVEAGTSQLGNDAGGHATSNRICEACHSKNKFHNYNTANNLTNGGNNNHANQSNCMGCHPHKKGFNSPGCNSCHGNPPTSSSNMVFAPSATGALANPATAPGAHAKHVTTKLMKCETCHTGNTMPEVSYTIQMGVAANSTNVPGFVNTVNGGTLSFPQDALLTNTYTFVASDGVTVLNKVANDNLNCTVYCHGNWAGNGGLINSPSWVGTSQAGCGACHSTSTTAPPQTGSHNTHVLSTGNVKLTCNKCHPAYSDTAHLDGNVAWALATGDTRIGTNAKYTAFGKTAAASGTTGNKAPSATYGTCSSIYCHGTNTPTWGGPNINCDGCHTASSLLEGNHAKHYASATVATGNLTTNTSTTTAYIFQCGTCHNPAATTHSGGVVSTRQAAEVGLAGGGTYTAAGTAAATSPDGSFAYTNGTCGFNACHNNGKATAGAPNVVATWTGTLPTNCTGCHNNNAASGSPMASNGHPSHVSAAAVMSIKPCQMCHDGTVDANDQAIADKTFHVNGTRDIRILGTWDSDATPNNNWNGTNCTNVYCHSTGQATPTYQSISWTTTVGCTGCHGGPGTTTTLTASHLAHIGTDPSDTNKQFGYTCDDCHVLTASNNSAISAGGLTYHINKTRDVSVAAANGGTGTIDTFEYNTNSLTNPDQPLYTCSTTNCHGGVSAVWTTGATNGNCSVCHGMSDPTKTGRDTSGDTADTDAQVGAHAAHLNSLNNYSADITCDQCHNATVSAMAGQSTYVNKVNVVGHIDSSLPAENNWGALATANSTPASYSTGVCSNYCHGATMANGVDTMPSWNQSAYLTGSITATGDCNRCHGAPPLITGHTGSETLAQCGNCHTDTMNTGAATFKDVTKHINGVTEVFATCTTCHGSLPPNTGSHPKHGIHLVQDIGMAAGNPDGVLADWNGTNYPACDVCHDMSNQANHLDPSSNILGAAAPANVWFLNGTPPTYDTGTQTCSNVACHLKPTPDWAP